MTDFRETWYEPSFQWRSPHLGNF